MTVKWFCSCKCTCNEDAFWVN